MMMYNLHNDCTLFPFHVLIETDRAFQLPGLEYIFKEKNSSRVILVVFQIGEV